MSGRGRAGRSRFEPCGEEWRKPDPCEGSESACRVATDGRLEEERSNAHQWEVRAPRHSDCPRYRHTGAVSITSRDERLGQGEFRGRHGAGIRGASGQCLTCTGGAQRIGGTSDPRQAPRVDREQADA
jgi:hypothetical protein